MKKFAIVGIGLVDSLGSNLEDNWLRYINGDVAQRKITNFKLEDFPVIKIHEAFEVDADKLDVSKFIPDKERRYLDRYHILGFYAAEQAINQANIIDPEKTAIIFSSLGGGTSSILDCTKKLLDGKRSTPRECLAAQRDSLPAMISRKFGFKGPNLNITSACASGIMALDYATKLLLEDELDQVVIGGCDVMIDPMDIYMFQSIGALDARNPPASLPFNENRAGFVMGEGSAVYVVKRLETALEHSDNILAVITGIGYASEAHHDTAVHPEGIGGRTSIDMALRRAKLIKEDIDIVNAHATSTPNGDEVEYNIITDYFLDKPIQALKANIGHTMAACGLIESAYLIHSLNKGCVNSLNKKVIGNFNRAIKNSFGFGGKCASIIVEKYQK